MLAQLVVAFEHLGIGGNLVMKIGAKESVFYASIIQAMDEQFERTQLVKPTTGYNINEGELIVIRWR
jgi:hypothetical protein